MLFVESMADSKAGPPICSRWILGVIRLQFSQELISRLTGLATTFPHPCLEPPEDKLTTLLVRFNVPTSLLHLAAQHIVFDSERLLEVSLCLS